MTKKYFKKFKIGQRIEVTWLDSNTRIKEEWADAEEFTKENSKMIIKSVSYFYGIVGKQLNIASDKMIDKKYVILINRKMTIPLGCVIKVRKK